jgi:formamidopyrimidine-DNA glycosylase
MPELPEVETVRRGLEELLDLPNETIVKVERSDKNLRYNASLSELAQVSDEPLKAIHRRAKYLLFELNNYFLLSHLGMTGSWRIEKESRKHDHIRIFLKKGEVLTYHDARRFGFFEVIPKKNLHQHPRFQGLGPDPVLDGNFDGDYLFKMSRGRKTPLKAFIMNQAVVVGVGNIYASEALFLAGLHPLLEASQLTEFQAGRLAESIREVLFDAIACGGSTISDFTQAGGSEGYFQNLFLVYGRAKQECLYCGDRVQSQAIVGRNSFWCPSCQKL